MEKAFGRVSGLSSPLHGSEPFHTALQRPPEGWTRLLPLVGSKIIRKEGRHRRGSTKPLGWKGEWKHGVVRMRKCLMWALKVGKRHWLAGRSTEGTREEKECRLGSLCELVSSPQKPAIIWAVRLESDTEERKECRQTKNNIPGDRERGLHPSTTREEGEKAGGQAGYLT